MRFTTALVALAVATAYAAPVANSEFASGIEARTLKPGSSNENRINYPKGKGKGHKRDEVEADDFEAENVEADDFELETRDVEADAFELDTGDFEAADVDADSQVSARAAGAIAGAAVQVLTPIATDLAQKAVNAAITATGNLLKAMKDWTSARENFTKTTVTNMMKSKPAGYVGAVCCNTGYKNSGGISPIVKAKLSASALHTDYDCFYVKKGNVFQNTGDGGFINLAVNGCPYTGGKMTC